MSRSACARGRSPRSAASGRTARKWTASTVSHRVYLGDEAQAPDPLIEAKQGAGKAPAYRGLAYLVFERLPLERWGNRHAADHLRGDAPGRRSSKTQMRAVTIIPGASEHGLDPLAGARAAGAGRGPAGQPQHAASARATGPPRSTNCRRSARRSERAALVVSWFGDDLRAGHCTLRPGVEIGARDETEAWRVRRCRRAMGRGCVSRVGGGPAYRRHAERCRGVARAIADLKARGLKVTYYPFVLMDVPAGNGLPDPYGAARAGGVSLARPDHAATWRRDGLARPTGRRRRGLRSTAFLGTAGPEHFSASGGQSIYAGPAEWSYRRMIFHQATLAAMRRRRRLRHRLGDARA